MNAIDSKRRSLCSWSRDQCLVAIAIIVGELLKYIKTKTETKVTLINSCILKRFGARPKFVTDNHFGLHSLMHSIARLERVLRKLKIEAGWSFLKK